MNKFTASASASLENALEIASQMGHTYIGSEHLLLGLLFEKNSAASRILNGAGLTAPRALELLSEDRGSGVRSNISAADMSPKAKKIIEASYMIAVSYGGAVAGSEHLLLAILREDDCTALRLLEIADIQVDPLLSETVSYCRSGSLLQSGDRDAPGRRRGEEVSPSLQRIAEYGKDLTAAAKAGLTDPVIGRERETSRVIRILSRRSKNNPVLIGEPGVGKTAIVEGLARAIAERSVPENLAGKKIFALDLSSMIAGARYRGDFEERLRRVINEAVSNRSIILFIDEIHTLLGAGSAEGAMDAANILKPVLARGEIQLIGATTLKEYRRIEKDAALERRFQSVTVNEPDENETTAILEGLREKYESHHALTVTDEAIKAAVGLSVRYIPERYLPDKAIDLIDEAAALLKTERLTLPEDLRLGEERIASLSRAVESAVRSEDFESAATLRRERDALAKEVLTEKEEFYQKRDSVRPRIGRREIARVVTEWTGIPVSSLEEGESERIARIEERLKESIVGQDGAISKTALAIKLCMSGVGERRGVAGSFIFAGPTGVGKTETARAVASHIFGTPESLIRLDMSEFAEKHSASRLIGSPPGYIGYGDGGQLTEAVRRRPYSAVLFDEIEKAHPDLLNLLLQILDDGFLTDSAGKKVSFRNCMIILTTNLGSGALSRPKSAPGFAAAAGDLPSDDAVRTALSGSLSPELLCRVDEIVLFKPLDSGSVRKITENKLSELSKRMSEKGYNVIFTDGYIDALAKTGFDPREGARSIEKAIRRSAEVDISELILSKKASPGDTLRGEYDKNSRKSGVFVYNRDKDEK